MLGKRRDSGAEDWSFLAELEASWSHMLSDLLTQNGVHFVTRDRMGAGMALKKGLLGESTIFYVPRAHYSRAADLLKNF